MSISTVFRKISTPGTASLDHFLTARSDLTPDQTAFAYLRDGEVLQCALTYRQLDEAATRVAAGLRAAAGSAGRVIIGLPPGIEFVTAFFGCLRAGAAAVPVPHYLGRRSMQRFAAIHRSANPAAIIVARSDRDRLVNLCQAHGVEHPAPVLAFEDLAIAAADVHRPSPPRADELAVIQYTSGSTRDPRGVLVTHGMLVHNCECVSTAHQYEHGTGLVTWLPAFHDMGLIGGLLNPLYAGLTSYIIDPAVFLQRPAVWLRAMSKYGCSHTGGPNFGYEHCVRMIRPDECDGLDLSPLRVASIGAEPVSPRTMRRFAERFGPYGFREAAFAPCYGLAEATLQVTAAEPGRTPRAILADRDALSRGSLEPRAGIARNGAAAGACEFASCGISRADTAVVIVDPETRAECEPRSVGEIWVSGPSVSAGYWNARQETDESFQAHLSDGRGPFLRTGDLGVLHDGELYVTGRMKDVLILRGQNYYPSDIEQIALAAHPDLVAEAAAAFAVAPHELGRIDDAAPDGERLVLVLEVRRERSRSDGLRDIITAVRAAVSEELGLNPAAIVLVRPGAIPRTSSGKVRKRAAREAFLAGELRPLARQVTEPALDVGSGNGHSRPQSATVAPATTNGTHLATPAPDDRDVEINRWLREYAGRHFDARLADERRCLPPHVVLDFGNQGLMGLRVPRVYGGLELSARAASRVVEQLAAIDLTLALFVGLHNSLGLLPILRGASPELRDAELPRLASGRALAAFALTEPGAGSHPQAIRSRAEPDGDGRWRLHGTKWWSGNAAWASVINVFAQTLDEHGQPAGISGFLVPRDSAGLRQGKESLTLGFRGMVQNTVHLEGVPVTSRQLLGRPGEGMGEALHAMMIARLGIAAMSLGAMKRCLRLVARFAERRDIGTGKLAENPTFRLRLAGHLCGLRALQELVDCCNGLLDRNGDVPEELYLVAKTAGPELLYAATDDAMQFLGGRGYIETNILPRMLRDARGLRIFEGPTETLHAHLGARLLASEACFTWLRSNLAAPRAVTALDAAKAELAAARDNAPASLDLLRWKQATLGEAATWLILAAVVESRTGGDDRTLAWLHARTASALRRWHGGAGPLHKGELYQQLDSAIGPVGDVWSEAAGEETLPDELLAPESSEPARPATPPIEPSVAKTDHAVCHVRSDDTADSLDSHTANWIVWLTTWIARKLQTPVDEIDPDATLVSLGLDSLNAVELAYAIEDEQGIKLPPTAAWSFPTVRSMARFLGSTQRTTPSVAIDVKENSQLAEVLDLAGRRPRHWNQDAKGI